MTTLLCEILGKLTGIYCLAVFFDFLFRKKTRLEDNKQKYIATLLSTIIYIVIPMWIYRMLNYDIYSIVGDVIISIICGLFVGIFFIREFQLKTYLLIIFYALIFWFTFGLLIIFILNLLGIYSSIIGTLIFVVSLTLSTILVLKQKLPLTKGKQQDLKNNL